MAGLREPLHWRQKDLSIQWRSNLDAERAIRPLRATKMDRLLVLEPVAE
jgi:hypothetical protein